MRLADKVAIVTGASQGLGEVIARAYAAAGAGVAVLNHGTPAKGREVVEGIAAAGGRAIHVLADIRHERETTRAVTEVIAAFGTVDILVNNAGIYRKRTIEETTEADWDDTLDTNLKGAFLMSKAVVPEFKRKRRGKIINISSVAGVGGFPGAAAYCASKGGLNLLTKALCLELSRFGINANTLSPGSFITPTNRYLREDAEWCAQMQQRTATGGDFVPAEAVLGAAVFLASAESDHVHGANLAIDEGWTAW
ncbi:MAG: SDR family NAD(P)-dependent oxidoreductase [Alphaproteobacteria bacterium]|nr:SDR family NAD(P)-dependent oxidoreductase [Alphaproteobacteria bacterium]